ncbi:MAG TPA: carboxypeptidase-like regulatory domain-containing protein [Terriglobales bacterium]|nr:carboxypeptidase-like regulatory domain-containing protein [Terriglobales bacterium]
MIVGTVFNEQGYAFPGVRVRIRRKGEKKIRYELYTNSRGEFVVRVPEGIEYEVDVTQKKYKEQTELVAAKVEDVQKRLSFKLELITPAKSGESK